ncbi:MAG: tetratricopeptide repeat protein [Phycisphaerales bacterium]|nr:tetratricopeptide repeat protein [Phycisphaerales bacterium]
MKDTIKRSGVVLILTLASAATVSLGQDAPTEPTTEAVTPVDQTDASQAPAQGTQAEPQAHFSRSAEGEILFQETQGKYYRNDLAGAEAGFSQLTQQDGGDVQAWYFLGLAQLDQGKYNDSVASFDQALRLDPTLTEVHAARAKAHIALQQYDLAGNDIAEFENDPAWQAQAAYLKGQIYYARGDLDQAARSFEVARKAGGVEEESAEFYQGLTYLRMRDLVRARSIYREAGLGGADRDPTVAAASRQLDDVLASQQRSSRPWELQITTGYEYDTNVLLIGSNIALPTEISNREDGRFVLQPRGSYSFYRKPNIDVGVEANGYFTFQQDITSFDISSYQIGPYVNYKLAENLHASARYGFNYVEFGHEKYLTRHLITPQLTLINPKGGYTSAYFQYQLNDFATEYDDPLKTFDRDGNSYVLGLVQGIPVPSLFDAQQKANIDLSYRVTYQDTQGQEYQGILQTLGVAYYTPLPFWNLRLDLGGTLTYEAYRNPSQFDDPGNRSRRRDLEYVLSIGVTHKINDKASLRVDYAYTNHNSNIEMTGSGDPFDYNRSIVGVRFIYTF